MNPAHALMAVAGDAVAVLKIDESLRLRRCDVDDIEPVVAGLPADRRQEVRRQLQELSRRLNPLPLAARRTAASSRAMESLIDAAGVGTITAGHSHGALPCDLDASSCCPTSYAVCRTSFHELIS